MKQWIILAVPKTELGGAIGAFGSGTVVYTGYKHTYKHIKKYVSKSQADRKAIILKNSDAGKRYFIFVEEITNGTQEKANAPKTRQRTFAF